VSFAAITLCVASQRVFIVASVYFVMTQSGNFLIHPRINEVFAFLCINFLYDEQFLRNLMQFSLNFM
jgi:hypothetical protein